MDTIVKKERPYAYRLDRLHFALQMLDKWPCPFDGEAVFNPKFPLAVPHFNIEKRFVTNVIGQIASQPWAIAQGFSLQPVGTHPRSTVLDLMRQPEHLPDTWDDEEWDFWQVSYQKGRLKLAGRAAIAEFFGIGEWYAGTIFQLYTHPDTSDPRAVVSHRLGHLVRNLEAR